MLKYAGPLIKLETFAKAVKGVGKCWKRVAGC